MRKTGFSLLAVLLLISLAKAQSTNLVGVTHRAFLRGDRSYDWRASKVHALTTIIWYPAAPGSVETPQWVGDPAHPFASAGRAATDAALAPSPAKFPLILLSHGTGGSALMMAWLGTRLAAHGYIAVAVNHPGNNGANGYTVQGFTLGWERAVDLGKVLDGMLADPEFGSRIDPRRIGAAGFSLGGYTMMVIAGAVSAPMTPAVIEAQCSRPGITDLICYDPPEFSGLTKQAFALARSDPRYASALTQSSSSHRDQRIRAVFAIAPVNLRITPASLEHISIPVEIVVGASDPIVPAPANASYLADHIPGAKLTIYPGGVQHYTFLDTCTPMGVQQRPDLCADKPDVDREAIHAEVAGRALRFFQRTLKP